VSFLRNEKVRGILYQLITIIGFVIFIMYVAGNTAHNIEARGIKSGFDFLNSASGFEITETPIPFSASSTHWEVFKVGLINTLIISFFGVILTSILGLIIGVARLSSNWIISRLAYTYIELFRNIPILLQILFWYNIVLASLPSARNSISFFDHIFLNKKGAFMPAPIFEDGSWLMVAGVVLAIALGFLVSKWAKKKHDETGKEFPVFITNLGLLILVPLIAYYASGQPLHFDYPEASRFGFKGGKVISPEFMALLFALSIYTATFVAEAIRSGIEAVAKGQKEAATALGLSPMQSLKLVVLPQAIRISIPPIINQYLNLIKNSSLAAAIGYPELVTVFAGTSLNITGQAIEIIAITMFTYLMISLIVSLILNWFNNKMKIKER